MMATDDRKDANRAVPLTDPDIRLDIVLWARTLIERGAEDLLLFDPEGDKRLLADIAGHKTKAA